MQQNNIDDCDGGVTEKRKMWEKDRERQRHHLCTAHVRSEDIIIASNEIDMD